MSIHLVNIVYDIQIGADVNDETNFANVLGNVTHSMLHILLLMRLKRTVYEIQ